MTLIGFGANQVQAANLGDGSFSVSYSSIDTYYGKEAPEYTEPGYLFAGWYEDEECTISYVKKDGETLSQYYAKFVPQDVLSVKAQNATTLHNKLLENTDVGKIRFVTSVDSLYYSEVGLHIEGKIGTHTLDKDYVVKQVYTHLYVVDTENDKSDARTAQQVFELDSAEYFAPYTFKINFTQFADGFTITPYWKTPDGVRVDGVTRTRSMIDNLEDGSCAQVNDRGFYTSNSLNVIIKVANDLQGTEENPTVITLLEDVELAAMQGINGYTRITNKPSKKVTISKADTWNGNGVYLFSTTGNVLEIVGADESVKDNIIIDGKEIKSLVYNNSTLIVKNATLKNGKIATTNDKGAVTGSGGAINNLTDSVYQITNCKFQNNSANNVGGAIYAISNGSSSYVLNSEFYGNTAGVGGAIYGHNSSSTTVTSCTFKENESTSTHGGAIYSRASLTVDDCVFESNKSTSWGGALMLETANGNGTVTASRFYDNSATYGGGLGISAATLNINSCEIGKESSGNEATNGGAIYVAGSGTVNLTVENQNTYKSLNYNTATKGGAIFNNAGSVSVSGYTFTNNSATLNGGAIYTKSLLDIDVCEFKSNTSNADGGAIMLDTVNGNGTVTASKFYQNVAINGGALSIEAATLNVTSCEIGKENLANTATTNGGAIYVGSGSANLTVDSQYEYKSLNYNTATNGGAICVSEGAVSVDGYTFKNNLASTSGGAIYSNDELDVTNCYFESNGSETTANGGAIMLDTDSSDGTVATSQFYKNMATYGGALSIANGTWSIEGCEFGKESSGNVATTNGGAIYVVGGTAILTAENSHSYKSLNYNKATNGGAIYVQSGSASVAGYEFTNNQATAGHGGAIFSRAGLTVSGGNFEGNSATGSTSGTGGAIYLLGAASNVGTVTGTTFYKNTAAYGGALGVNGATLNVTSCEMGKENSGNAATTGGGAVYVANKGSANFTVNGQSEYKSLNYNSATNGGAIYVNAGSASVNGYTFTSNSASTSGGAIYSKAGLDVTNCDFESNGSNASMTTVNGGAIMLDTTDGNGTVTASRFYKNSATNGGAINNEKAKLDIISCEMGKEDFGNTATTNGGAIYVGSGTVTLSVNDQDTYQSLNYNAAANGGAIYVKSGSLSVKGYNFTSNSAATSGGAIFSRAGLTVTGGKYVSNKADAGFGGAIYMLGTGTGTVTEATFYRNTAVRGGAVACDSVNLTMTNCDFNTVQDGTIEGNTSTKNTGSVAWVNGSAKIELLINDSTARSLKGNNTKTLWTNNANSTIEYSNTYSDVTYGGTGTTTGK